jgi:hypothetical protein
MSQPLSDSTLLQYNQRSLEELENVLRYEAGEFSLTLASCNYHRLRNLVIQPLERGGLATTLRLPSTVLNLREAIHEFVQGQWPPALFVIGLDYLPERQLKQVLDVANKARDQFRKDFPFPLVLWMNRHVQQMFARYAADFRSFAPAAIAFTLPPEELIYALTAGTNQVFSNVLERGGDRVSTTLSVQLKASDAVRSELEFALHDLTAYGVVPDPVLQASVDFLQGREAHSRLEMETARERYERSLAYWQSLIERAAPDLLPAAATSLTTADKRAVLWLHLGWWHRNSGVLQRAIYQSSLRQARVYFEQMLEAFRAVEQTEHLARFIHVLAEVLQKQQDWETLETLALEGITLHQETQDPVRLARDRGFLAEIALQHQDWLTAENEAQAALDLLEAAETTLADTPEDIELDNALEIAKSFQRGWYRFLLGEARLHLSDPEAALEYLEAARWETDPEVDLALHLRVLNELIDRYFDLGHYLEAFDVKQERRQVQYRYNLRAFVGAGAIQPHPRTTTPQTEDLTQSAVAAEIRASGRLQDVEALANRIQSNQYAIVVVHGPSGVGKSSILTAGLLPCLRKLFPDGRTTLPILVQTYGNWPQAIVSGLEASLHPARKREETPPTEGAAIATVSPTAVFARLRTAIAQRHFLVLIFDQFEEFFIDRKELSDRRNFYTLLRQCIDEPWIKVVLSLREDYLHYLLETERYINADNSMGDWDLLSRQVRYPLANFTPAAAEAVIRQLTAAAQSPLEEALIHRLVADLSDETGDVRPIELQVVGAQLQRQEIDTLAQYEALGNTPKETLVQAYLAYVVRDCGPPNERLAWVVLYLLTDEDRDQRLYRPLKTREALEYELSLLEMPYTPEQLSLVLTILVGAGLVFEIPEEPENRFQLVHDYLVSYVRDVQTPGLMAELQEARTREQAAAAAQEIAEIERDRLAEANAVLTAANAEAEHKVTEATNKAHRLVNRATSRARVIIRRAGKKAAMLGGIGLVALVGAGLVSSWFGSQVRQAIRVADDKTRLAEAKEQEAVEATLRAAEESQRANQQEQEAKAANTRLQVAEGELERRQKEVQEAEAAVEAARQEVAQSKANLAQVREESAAVQREAEEKLKVAEADLAVAEKRRNDAIADQQEAESQRNVALADRDRARLVSQLEKAGITALRRFEEALANKSQNFPD